MWKYRKYKRSVIEKKESCWEEPKEFCKKESSIKNDEERFEQEC